VSASRGARRSRARARNRHSVHASKWLAGSRVGRHERRLVKDPDDLPVDEDVDVTAGRADAATL
jgi:hypothetical protein